MTHPDFDTARDFLLDSPGKDPDTYSEALRTYHQLLWSKPLPNGRLFALETPKDGYLTYTDAAGVRHWYGSDAITHSYTGWTKSKALVEAIASLSEEQRARYLNPPYTIASVMIWPLRSADLPSINQARGTRGAIADRMDLTLECIRRHYAEEDDSPLADRLTAYADFFALFETFRGFVDFFHFQDLVNDDESVRFYLPFDGAWPTATPASLDEYVTYREATLTFIEARGRRMAGWVQEARR